MIFITGRFLKPNLATSLLYIPFFFYCLGVLAGEDCFSDHTHTCVLLCGREGKRRDKIGLALSC